MRKLSKKYIFMLMIITLAIILIPIKVYAAGKFSISKSSASVTTGGTTTITVTASDCAGKFSISSSNTSVATVSTSSVWIDNSSATITITAKSVGTANITVTATDVTDTDLDDVTGTKTFKLTVKAKSSSSSGTSSSSNSSSSSSSGSSSSSSNSSSSSSSNSSLSSLQIAEGSISPEFSSSVKEYAINVANDITKLSISATADHSKATVKITGNEELKVGENNINVVVTAEDGSTTTYKIIATRAEEELKLQELSIYFIDENGEKIVLPLTPTFTFDTYEYTLEKLEYTINSIEIEAVANKENANIEITGNEELKAGENEITIKVTLTNEDNLEEEKTYKITVEREEEPVELTTIEKIKNWFGGVGSTISKWATGNFNKIITGMLLISTTLLIGLTIYFVYDYKNYLKLLAKLAEYNKENLVERANVALNPEDINYNIEKEIEQTEEKLEEQEGNSEIKLGKGKRFK